MIGEKKKEVSAAHLIFGETPLSKFHLDQILLGAINKHLAEFWLDN